MKKICMNCGFPQLPSIEEKMKEEQHKWAKWAEAMAKPVEKAQRQESIDPEEEFKTHLALTSIGRAELRTKALELAMTARGKPFYNDYYEECDILSKAADRFYTYITKGK